MQILLVLLGASGSTYFMLVRRRFDYFALAFFSAMIYFMPGFAGSAANYVDGVWTSDALHPEAIGIMAFVLVSIWLSAMIAERAPAMWQVDAALPGEASMLSIVLLLALAGLAGLVASAGSSLLDPDKDVVLENLNRWHILFYAASTLGLPIAVIGRRHGFAALFLSLLLFDLYIGFRSSLAIAIIATVVLHLHSNGRERLLASNWKLLLFVLLLGVFMFGYKMVRAVARLGLWDQVWANMTNPNALYLMVAQSEPFLVQQTLNQVVANHFETGLDHVLSSLYQFVLFAPELGAENVTFNGIFQPALFPDVSYGLAANIWAQMWSAGGWPLLIGFTLVFNLILGLGNISLRARSAIFRAGCAPMFCYWAFYIHRNELSYALALEKRQLLLLMSVSILAAIVRRATRATPSRGGHMQAVRG